MRLGRDSRNYLLVQINNGTQQAVKNVAFVVQFVNAEGKVQKAQFQVPDRLEAQGSTTLATGIGPFNDLNNVQGQVVQAQVVE